MSNDEKTFGFQMSSHINADTYGLLTYTCDDIGLAKTVHTPRRNGKWGLGTASFHLSDSDKEFKTLAEAVAEMRAIGNGEFPDREEFLRQYDAKHGDAANAQH